MCIPSSYVMLFTPNARCTLSHCLCLSHSAPITCPITPSTVTLTRGDHTTEGAAIGASAMYCFLLVTAAVSGGLLCPSPHPPLHLRHVAIHQRRQLLFHTHGVVSPLISVSRVCVYNHLHVTIVSAVSVTGNDTRHECFRLLWSWFDYTKKDVTVTSHVCLHCDPCVRSKFIQRCYARSSFIYTRVTCWSVQGCSVSRVCL